MKTMNYVVGMSLFCTVALSTGCKSNKFSSESSRRTTGNSATVPPGTTPDPNAPIESGGNDPGGEPGADPTPQLDENGNPINIDGGTSSAKRVPLKMTYDLKEANDNSDYKNGTFEFSLKRISSSGSVSTKVLALKTLTAGEVGKASIENICECEKENHFQLFIKADGQNKSLDTGWKSEVMAGHSKPSGADDWANFLKSSDASKEISSGDSKSTIYLGGFDNVFLFGQSCGVFACDDREWNNRDNVRVILMCDVSQCPKREAGLSLKFKGQDN